MRTVTRDEFLADLPRILHAMDQPSVDGINTWYASKAVAEAWGKDNGTFVQRHATAGGDAFAGKDRHAANRAQRRLQVEDATRLRAFYVPLLSFLPLAFGLRLLRRRRTRR